MVCSLIERRLSTGCGAPQRLTLLDPYFTNFGKRYLGGQWTGERVRQVVRAAADAGAAIEQYRSSMVLDNPLSDSNDELILITAYVVMRPEFLKIRCGPGDIDVLAQRHSYARYTYFRSKNCSGPPPCGESGEGAGHAAASDAQIRAMMG